MKKLQEIAGPSCLTKAADDEPLFVLRANDELASHLVREWACRYRDAKGGMKKMTPVQIAKCREALSLADEMEEWRGAKQSLG